MKTLTDTNQGTLPTDPDRYAPWADHLRITALLIVGVTIARLVYLAWLNPYTLVEDEAHYWEWSRNLDLSYYSKGPGVAWLIAASTWLFGISEFTVRLPATLFSAVAAVGVAGLTFETIRDKRAVFFAVACFELSHMFQFSSLLMTIDMPYVACWALACWAGVRAMKRESALAWPALGAAIGIGFLFKYTILLVLPGLILYAFVRPRPLRVSARWRAAMPLSLLVFSVCILPVIIWNANHDWPTLKHLLGHLGVEGGDLPASQTNGGRKYDPMWTLEFLAVQVVMVGAPLALMLYSSIEAFKRRHDEHDAWPARLTLICCGLPLLLFYLGVTFFTRVEGNWPMAAYVSLFPIAGWGVVDATDSYRRRRAEGASPRRTHRQIAWQCSIWIGLVIGALLMRLDFASKLPLVRDIAPMGRLMGADQMAASVAKLAKEVEQETGQEPLIVAQHYGRSSLMAFYLPGRPTVYCASSLTGGRRTQYDFWAHTDLNDLEKLGSLPAVLIGGSEEQWAAAFDRVELFGQLEGESKSGRQTFIGYGYRGFGPKE